MLHCAVLRVAMWLRISPLIHIPIFLSPRRGRPDYVRQLIVGVVLELQQAMPLAPNQRITMYSEELYFANRAHITCPTSVHVRVLTFSRLASVVKMRGERGRGSKLERGGPYKA